MSAGEMIHANGPREFEAERFLFWLCDSGAVIDTQTSAQIQTATKEEIYGPVVATTMEYVRQLETAPALALDALKLLTFNTLAARADMNGTERQIGDDFLWQLKTTQEAMASGEILLLPEEYGMTRRQGLDMALRADRGLGGVSPKVQEILAEANYSSYFSGKTMASGQDLLMKRVEDVIENKGFDQMPHLVRSNYAIGQLAASFAAHKSDEGRLVLWDQGTGSGATIARIAKELSGLEYLNGVTLIGNEPNPDYYAQSGELIEQIAQLLHAELVHGGDIEDELEESVLGPNNPYSIPYVSLHMLGTQEMSDRLFPGALSGKQDVLAVDANYVWHRLPTKTKAKTIDSFVEAAPNVIIYGADMGGNMSTVNRRYFNFGNNGPLNAGNLGLRRALDERGFTVTMTNDPGVDFKSIHPKLMERLRQDAGDDGFFMVAYKGAEAERLVLAA